jgi:hypothetical protein
MTTQTFDVRRGLLVPSCDGLTLPEVRERRDALQRRLTELRNLPVGRVDLDEREQIKAEIAVLEARSSDLKDMERQGRQRRAFAGVGSPFYDAVRERLGDGAEKILAHLEERALELLGERERRTAERRAAKHATKADVRTG